MMDFGWLSGVDTTWAVVLVTAGYAALLLWALTRPARLIYGGAPDRARWRDLRLWILPLILVQVALYWIFR